MYTLVICVVTLALIGCLIYFWRDKISADPRWTGEHRRETLMAFDIRRNIAVERLQSMYNQSVERKSPTTAVKGSDLV